MSFTEPGPPSSDHLAPRYQDSRLVYLCDGLVVRRCALDEDCDGGGRLRFAERHTSLPGRVVLVDPRTGASRLAEVVWRSETEIGVHFLERGQRYRVLKSAADLAWNVETSGRRAS